MATTLKKATTTITKVPVKKATKKTTKPGTYQAVMSAVTFAKKNPIKFVWE